MGIGTGQEALSRQEAFTRHDAPAAGVVRAAVERIVQSNDFTVPGRARKFLTYVVDETLDGRADRIKAYSIAIEVFGRSVSFDAQSDPVVRIEAGRVRRALEHYYLTAGRDDPVVIAIPKGGYVPRFSWQNGHAPLPAIGEEPPPETGSATPSDVRSGNRGWPALGLMAVLAAALALVLARPATRAALNDEAASAAPVASSAAAPDVPHLVVVPFADLSGTASSASVARGLTEEVIGQIAKFKEVVVMIPAPASAPSQDGSAADKPRYALEGSVLMEGQKLRLVTRLMNRREGTVVWADNYDEDLGRAKIIDVQAGIAGRVASAVAQPYGAIYSTDAVRLTQTASASWDAYACTLAYYAYRAELNPQKHEAVENCLTRTTEQFPHFATAWALLSLTYLDEMRFHYAVGADRSPPLDRALAAARRAVELDPGNVRGLQAYMTALFFQNDVDAALKIGAEAVEINPNDTELAGEYGMRLALSGQWQRGREILLQVLDRNPGPLGYFESVVALSYYMQGDYPAAAEWIRKANLEANPIYHVIAAAIFGQLGKPELAGSQRDWLLAKAPDLAAELPQAIRMRNIPQGDAAHLIEGLRKAGLASVGE